MNKRFNKNHVMRRIDVAYMQPSESRRLSIDMPIGDPNGGPASGAKDMPVVVVALAAGSFAAGAAAIATATTLLATVSAGALMVGSALTIAGTITGNQKLTKIGGIVSLAGGIGSLANNLAGGAGAAAGAGAENVAPVLTDAASDAVTGSLADAASGAATDSVTGLATDAVSSSGGGLIDAVSPAATEAATAAGSGLTDVASTAATPGAQVAANSATSQAAGSPFLANGGSAFAPDATNAFAAPATGSNGLLGGLEQFDGAAHTASLVQPEATGIQGYFDKAGNFIKNNKEIAQIGLNAVGGLAKGLVPSQQEKAQTALLKQQAERERIRQLWRQGKIA